MLISPQKVFVSICAADFRKSYDGLSGLVRAALGKEPTDGSFYVFFNKKRDQVKMLYYEKGGYCLWSKRLEQGGFAPLLTNTAESSYVTITSTQFMMLIEGISLENRGKYKRHNLQKSL